MCVGSPAVCRVPGSPRLSTQPATANNSRPQDRCTNQRCISQLIIAPLSKAVSPCTAIDHGHELPNHGFCVLCTKGNISKHNLHKHMQTSPDYWGEPTRPATFILVTSPHAPKQCAPKPMCSTISFYCPRCIPRVGVRIALSNGANSPNTIFLTRHHFVEGKFCF